MFKLRFQYQAKIHQDEFIQKMNDISFFKSINPEVLDIRFVQGTTLNEKNAKYIFNLTFRGKEFLREGQVIESTFPEKSIILVTDSLSDAIIESTNRWDGDLLTSTVEYEWRLKKAFHRIFEPFVADSVKNATLERLQKIADGLSHEKTAPVKTLSTKVWGIPIKLAVALLVFLFFLFINFAAADQWETFYGPESEMSDC